MICIKRKILKKAICIINFCVKKFLLIYPRNALSNVLITNDFIYKFEFKLRYSSYV